MNPPDKTRILQQIAAIAQLEVLVRTAVFKSANALVGWKTWGGSASRTLFFDNTFSQVREIFIVLQ